MSGERKLDLSLKSHIFRYFVGRKRTRKFERVCGSFLELKDVVTILALRFRSGSRGRATENFGLRHQGSSLESSKIDPL